MDSTAKLEDILVDLTNEVVNNLRNHNYEGLETIFRYFYTQSRSETKDPNVLFVQRM